MEIVVSCIHRRSKSCLPTAHTWMSLNYLALQSLKCEMSYPIILLNLNNLRIC